MHLHKFIYKREFAWSELDSVLHKVERRGLKCLSEAELSEFISAYRQTAADFNYLQTHYPESRYCSYLNGLLTRCHSLIHVEEGFSLQKAWHFLKTGFPRLLIQERSLFCLAAATFMLAFLVAYFSVLAGAPWAEALIPQQLHLALEERIVEVEEQKAIIPPGAQPFFASFIMTNNIQVSFLAFAGGVLFGLGTAYVLFANGVMLGVVAAFYARSGYSLYFWSLVLPHGVMELAAIFISAAAGLALGRALLMPGDYTRKDALSVAGRRAVALLLGTLPLFIIAALIEGFFTPAPLHYAWKLLLAGVTAVMLLFYFLPRQQKKARYKRWRLLSSR